MKFLRAYYFADDFSVVAMILMEPCNPLQAQENMPENMEPVASAGKH